ncbi:MAG: hypothetical protein WCG98_03145 [bacterium]
MVLAEIEFTSEQEANNFTAPARLGQELTGMAEAENAYLAKYGIPDSLRE